MHQNPRVPSENDIAIIGIACVFPGADSIEEYWQLLYEGKSMHQQVPKYRFPNDTGDRLWGNFLADVDRFDHSFFGISSREAQSMDPQQRLLLELAYNTLRSAGYFDGIKNSSNVGSFIGVGSVDYQDNVASHLPSAFSALGTLRAFISGRISHHFGWDGPSATIDTACSSSAVAIHMACKAIQSGECMMALAGGINIITSPKLFLTLGKAGFLSPTGPCKSFDQRADGYCRGEGAGLVLLKRLSTAIADGDLITGIIIGSAVSQSGNSTPITVPDIQSHTALYRRVTSTAGIDPWDISYVEAHGTGTPIGDPTECESIRQVFGGPERRDKLFFGSVKANIGHTEAASGIAALIKAVLMLQKARIPEQANFSILNRRISPLEPDRMEIPRSTQEWCGETVCISNYGAAGNLAALLVCRPQANAALGDKCSLASGWGLSYKSPIFLSAHTSQSLRILCMKLHEYLETKIQANGLELNVESVAFTLAHNKDHSLQTFTALSASSISDLSSVLTKLGSERSSFEVQDKTMPKSVVLCFGGQTSDRIGLSEGFYHGSLVFRSHLDRCNELCIANGIGSFYPDIFQKGQIKNIILLHCMLFSLQYSCAKSWIDCGLGVSVVIGHSFGQLPALAVSGSISLEEGMNLVKERAVLIEELWGQEKGAMLAIEADLDTVSAMLKLSAEHCSCQAAEVACLNGPTSHVVAGTELSIRAVEEFVSYREKFGAMPKIKRLQVTHGFHSRLVEPIIPRLTELARHVNYWNNTIPIETCTQNRISGRFEASHLARQLRDPVYFSHALQRIQAEYGTCIWLEAGSDTGVTRLVSRAIEPSVRGSHTFQTIAITSSNAMQSLSDAIINLWNVGLRLQFWPHHRMQRSSYYVFQAPQYQFASSRHWLDYKSSPAAASEEHSRQLSPVKHLLSLVSLLRPQKGGESVAEFAISPESPHFQACVEGHRVLGSALTPASLYIHLATKAASSLSSDDEIPGRLFTVADLDIRNPMGSKEKAIFSLIMQAADDSPHIWKFKFCLDPHESRSVPKVYATGNLIVHATNDTGLITRFSAHAKDAGTRHTQLLTQGGADNVIEGSIIYKMFSVIVEYSEYFRGVRKIVSKGVEAAGLISLPKPPKHLVDDTSWYSLVLDNFIQVAGFHVNCLQDRNSNQICVCTKVDSLEYSPKFKEWGYGPWAVFSHSKKITGRETINDIFVFEPTTNDLVLIILDARFTEVDKDVLVDTLSSLHCREMHSPTPLSYSKPLAHHSEDTAPIPSGQCESVDYNLASGPEFIDNDLLKSIQQMLNGITDVPIRDMKLYSRLEAIGVDSLMTVEVVGEIETTFGINIPMHEFQDLVDLRSLCLRIGSISTPSFQAPSLGSPDNESPSTDIEERLERVGVSKSAVSECASILLSMVCPKESILEAFHLMHSRFDIFAQETRFAGFWQHVHKRQQDLVITIIIEAFELLGCSLSGLRKGDAIPEVRVLQKHSRLLSRLYRILEEASLIHMVAAEKFRTSKGITRVPSQEICQNIIDDFPHHASEHRLLGYMGSHLADCLAGKLEGVNLMFGGQDKRNLLTELYTKAPNFETGTKLLVDLLRRTLAARNTDRPIRILEVGAGTGATTRSIVDLLKEDRIPCEYTFTDLSSSLVAEARRTYADNNWMIFEVLDIEKMPPQHLIHSQDIVIASNAVHATRNLARSCSNVKNLLLENGIFCLVEITKSLSWYDLVFGLLEGWWHFQDGREHAIAHESLWKENLVAAGFQEVHWSTGDSAESDQIRLIVAISCDPIPEPKSETLMETVLMHKIGDIPLYADLYYPGNVVETRERVRPIGKYREFDTQYLHCDLQILTIQSTYDSWRRQCHAISQRRASCPNTTAFRQRTSASQCRSSTLSRT